MFKIHADSAIFDYIFLSIRINPDKVFWRGGGGRTFCSQKGGLPLAPILSATAGDPAHAGRWPQPHGREQ